MYTYDPQQKCYRGWWFGSDGQVSEASGQWDADTKTLKWTFVASDGKDFTRIHRHRFVNDNKFEAISKTKDSLGKVLSQIEVKGTRAEDSEKREYTSSIKPESTKEPTTSSLEQKVLDRFIGTWQTNYKLDKAEWTPVETTGTAEFTYRRVLGGNFVQEQVGPADNLNYLTMHTYDIQQKCYRSWGFSYEGRSIEYTGQWNADTNTISWKSIGQDFTTTARHHFVNDNQYELFGTTKDSQGKVLFKMKMEATRTEELKQ